MVSVVQRELAAKNPRATFKAPITIEDVLNSRMIAYPFRLLQCCLVTDGDGASTRKLPYSHLCGRVKLNNRVTMTRQ
jgi:acetyl-CoA acetyltransferase